MKSSMAQDLKSIMHIMQNAPETPDGF